MSAMRNPVPDLLNRFVATPYKLASNGTVVETNELPLLEQIEARYGIDGLASLAPDFHIRVVREASPGADSEARRFHTGTVSIILVGTGTILLADREQRGVFCFLGSEVTDERFVQELLPQVLETGHSRE